MRDILILLIVFTGCAVALKRPWIGVMLWTWLSIMNPHRYAFGFAYNTPVAAMAVACTAIGFLMTRNRESPFKGGPVVWLVILMAWMTLSWLLGLDVEKDFEQWKKVMKIDGMILLGLALLHSKEHILAMMSVCVGSLGLLGVKGGLYTVLGGGGGRVWGPPGSFIEDNNEFALALVMTIPLLRFLQLQMASAKLRLAMAVAMGFLAVSALGSQSRGALLAISAMAAMLWLRGSNKFGIGIVLVAFAVPLVMFMPAEWTARMSTIKTYDEDASAMGRISAWYTSWNLAMTYPFGVGFNIATREISAKFSPYPDIVLVAHSIYFQILGHHGFIGLGLFLLFMLSIWRCAGWLRKQKNLPPEATWCNDLGAMCQVAIVGFAVGGAFLSMAYFDLLYNIMAMLVLTKVWVEKQSWKTERSSSPRWMELLSLIPRSTKRQAP